ncbi:hypothetical protein CF65_01674 [Aggregatibacter actinomycetemcomitans HK1651]|nr:hypothetical protein CF65_01674 [Aggregatibacter actinomycetemcomitans HK1651]
MCSKISLFRDRLNLCGTLHNACKHNYLEIYLFL